MRISEFAAGGEKIAKLIDPETARGEKNAKLIDPETAGGGKKLQNSSTQRPPEANKIAKLIDPEHNP